jgi:uncharacterized protein YabE (DUF348 family)
MKNPKILIPVAAGILIGLALTVASFVIPSQKTVTVLFEGQPIEVHTNAQDVRGALNELGFSPKPEDEIDPAADSRLTDGQTITYAPAIEVNLSADGQEYILITPKRTPSLWLAEADIALSEDDQLYLNGEPTLPEQPIGYIPVVHLEVRRAVTINLESGAGQFVIRSAAHTLGQALWDAGFNFSTSDVLSPALETPLTAPITVQLQAGRQISIQVDEQTLAATTSAETVGVALAQVGLSLQGLDYSIPAASEPLPADGQITVVRVQEEIIINQETIPFETIFTALDDVEIDNYKVTQVGQVGLKGQRVRVRYENGAEAKRVVEDEWVLRDPQPRIEGYGTKIVVRTENTADGPIEYWRKVEMYATSYKPCGGGQDRCYYYTSLGYEVKQGVAAVIYDWFIPMGNHTVYVPGYGHAVIADVGGGIPGRHWIDLGYSEDDYVPWAQWVTVYFTTPIPPADEILWVLPYK